MNELTEQLEDAGLLAAALCDGDITPQQAARLERLARDSREVRQYLSRYLHLHGELYWQIETNVGRLPSSSADRLLTACCSSSGPAQPDKPVCAGARRPVWSCRWGFAAAAVALSAAVLTVWVSLNRPAREDAHKPPASACVAQLQRTFEATWAPGKTCSDGENLRSGQTLNLRDGFAEIRFSSGAGVILQGPATFDVETLAEGFLREGSLVAYVPGRAAGFTIRTPNATVVDRGTQFGVAASRNGPSEVHVFAGSLAVYANRGPAEKSEPVIVSGGRAVRVSAGEARFAAAIEPIALASGSFVRTFPTSGSVSVFRALVASHPNLIHHYTFEGTTPREKREDKKGSLSLVEVVMRRGAGAGGVDYSASGFDATSDAVRPYRCPHEGNQRGMGLLTEASFQPPKELTVELLLAFDGVPASTQKPWSVAVGTRADTCDCGFFVVASGRGRLVHLMDRNADWVEGDVQFQPGEWYYVASTFQVASGKTLVNSYVANLSQGERTLKWVVRNQVAEGMPAVSRLGIGKGFAEDISHAYPWSGSLDEVAVYDVVVDRETLQKRLRCLLPGSVTRND